MTDHDLNDLLPMLQEKAIQFLQQCAAQGLHAVITETWRNPAREDALHAQGITPATSKTCKHCYEVNGKPASKAFDFILFDENNRIINDGTDERYILAGQIAKGLGLTWGGDFKHKDFDHAEV